MVAMIPRLLAHRPTVAMSLSCIACSCARVKKYEASAMPPRSRATAPAMRDAAQQRQHGGLFELLLRAGAQVGEQLDIAPRIGQLLRDMEWSERAAQLGREVGFPALTRQMADFALRAKAGEGGPCLPGGG